MALNILVAVFLGLMILLVATLSPWKLEVISLVDINIKLL